MSAGASPCVTLGWGLSLRPRELEAAYLRKRVERLIWPERLHLQLNVAVLLLMGVHFRRQMATWGVLDACTIITVALHALVWLLSHRTASYARWRGWAMPALRAALVAYGSKSLYVRSMALAKQSSTSLDPRLIVILSTAGFAHSFNKPLDMHSFQLPLAQEALFTCVHSAIDLCSQATANHVASLSRSPVFEVRPGGVGFLARALAAAAAAGMRWLQAGEARRCVGLAPNHAPLLRRRPRSGCRAGWTWACSL
jgi:hypothetical protein